MDPKLILVASDEDANSGGAEPFPVSGAGGRQREPRQVRDFYRRRQQEEPLRQFRHTL